MTFTLFIGYGRGRGGKSSLPGELYKHMRALLWLYSYGSLIYIQNYLNKIIFI
jgi:hypothetical protein